MGLSHYFCKKNKHNYIFIANLEGIFAYSIDDLHIIDPQLYYKFIPQLTEEERKNNGFDEPYVIEENEKFILIGPCFYYGYIFFWDFFEHDLIYKMKLDSGISDICIWSKDYFFASLNHSTSQFVLINAKKREVEKKFEVNDEDPRGCGIKVVKNKEKGSYLISSSINGKLNLYSIYDL